MSELESSFAQLLGRQPSEQEIEALYRVKNALKIGDNDALWLVLMALQSYDSLYRRYPSMIADEVKKIVDMQRLLIAETAAAETTRAIGSLSEAVSQTSWSIAASVAESTRILSWGWLLLGLVGFGGLCTFVGAALATGSAPYWVGHPGRGGWIATTLGTLAKTPAGWIAAVTGVGAGIAALLHSWPDVIAGRRWTLVASTGGMLFLSLALLASVL